MAEEDWDDLKGYLRNTAKLPTTTLQSSKQSSNERLRKVYLPGSAYSFYNP